MKTEFKKGFLVLLAFSLITALLVFFTNPAIPHTYPPLNNWMLWLFFTSSTLLIHYILLSAAQKKPAYFIRLFIGITSIKLFIYLLLITVYAFFNKPKAFIFIISFLSFYLLYSVCEVILLIKYFRH